MRRPARRNARGPREQRRRRRVALVVRAQSFLREDKRTPMLSVEVVFPTTLREGLEPALLERGTTRGLTRPNFFVGLAASPWCPPGSSAVRAPRGGEKRGRTCGAATSRDAQDRSWRAFGGADDPTASEIAGAYDGRLRAVMDLRGRADNGAR